MLICVKITKRLPLGAIGSLTLSSDLSAREPVAHGGAEMPALQSAVHVAVGGRGEDLLTVGVVTGLSTLSS
jgi:hypothetical protein